jgi:hypothetical protein
MVETTIALTIFDKFLKIVGLIRSGEIQRNEQIDQSLHALYDALAETKKYVARLNEGQPHDRRHEMEIAHMWHKASVPIRHIDSDLAHKCFIKGSYWHDPKSWTDVKVRESGIALDQVLESTKQLLLIDQK